MTDFKPAVRNDTVIVLALAGASGSGKTKSALELAVGLAHDRGEIAMVDSEGCRGLHYADDYKFLHHDWRPPFSPDQLGALLREIERRKYAVAIVDSMSDEHEGEGGLCDMAAAALEDQKGTKNSAAAWAFPKARHKLQIVRWLRQSRCHVIFCLRADERVEFQKDERGRTVIVPRGWVPIAEKRLLYDVTTSLLFEPYNPGVPKPIKLYDKHAPFFPPNRQVSREAGRRLAEWAAGGQQKPETEPLEVGVEQLAQTAEAAARQGSKSLKEHWERELTKRQRQTLAGYLPSFRGIAAAADHEAGANG